MKLILLTLVLVGCESSNDGGLDAAPMDASAMDASPIDASPIDASPIDASPIDASPIDASEMDAEPIDASEMDASVSGATLMGTLTLPGTEANRMYSVRVVTAPGQAPVAEISGLTSGNLSLPYSIANVPAGVYFLLAFVDVDGSGGTSSTPGDYAGWYGHNGDGNPPPAANAAIPASGTVTFDWSLVLR